MQKEKLEFILAIVSVSIFVLILIVAGFMLFRIYLKRKSSLLMENQRMAIEFEQTLLASKLEIQEETFTYIGQEIHDNIGQVLSLVRLNLNTLDRNANEKKLDLMDELMAKAITDLRSLSHLLDTDYIRTVKWEGAVEKLFLDLKRTEKYAITISIEEDLPVLDEDKAIILFRMIQEIVNNIIKHAGATSIKFNAEEKERQIAIQIEDNGKGFDTSSEAAGRGLKNLQARSKMIGASVNFNSEMEKGTMVTILINGKNNE